MGHINYTLKAVLFHLPFGILFTIHSQYTNPTNNPLAKQRKTNIEQLLKRFTTSIIPYASKDFVYLHRGIFSIKRYLSFINRIVNRLDLKPNKDYRRLVTL
jgi:hypothetical protein